jgi:DNA-binding transcriptional LysR family regulator
VQHLGEEPRLRAALARFSIDAKIVAAPAANPDCVITLRSGAPILEIKHVRSFLAVARALNFSRAARALHLSQPALSTQIKTLEEDLGADLFVRNRRSVSLTPVGQTFIVDAENLLKQIADTELRIKRISSGDVGHLRIGFVASATLGLVPAVAVALKKQYPGVSFELKNIPTVRQVEALRNGTLDAGLVRMPLQAAGLTIALVDREPFAIALSREHPLARKRNLQVSDLKLESFIAYGERWAPSFYQTWTGMCRDAGYTPHVIQETGEMDTAVALVAAGLGVAILPHGIARRSRSILSVTVLLHERRYSEIGIAVATDRKTPLLDRLISIAKEVGRH